jgi:hypothetical protein
MRVRVRMDVDGRSGREMSRHDHRRERREDMATGGWQRRGLSCRPCSSRLWRYRWGDDRRGEPDAG